MTEPGYPQRRLRRLRRGERLRDAVADVSLTVDRLIYPLFVGDLDAPQPVASMPGVAQLPVSDALKRMTDLTARGLRQFLLFGVTAPGHKDAVGSYAAAADAPVNQLLARARDAGLDAMLYADLCFCEYTDHGHCGVLTAGGELDNDATLEHLARTAVVQAEAG
ncbi:MAG: hypothetical protein WD118_02600, partial [Phycisphaeraceae bacterium]